MEREPHTINQTREFDLMYIEAMRNIPNNKTMVVIQCMMSKDQLKEDMKGINADEKKYLSLGIMTLKCWMKKSVGNKCGFLR